MGACTRYLSRQTSNTFAGSSSAGGFVQAAEGRHKTISKVLGHESVYYWVYTAETVKLFDHDIPNTSPEVQPKDVNRIERYF